MKKAVGAGERRELSDGKVERSAPCRGTRGSVQRRVVTAQAMPCDSWRLKDASRCADLRLCRGLRVLLEYPPLSGRSALPVVESPEERIGIFVPQEVGSFTQLHR